MTTSAGPWSLAGDGNGTMTNHENAVIRNNDNHHGHAYVTLIASEEYLIGAQILVCRLRAVSPGIPILVLVDQDQVVVTPSMTRYFEETMQSVLVPTRNPALGLPQGGETRRGTYTKFQVWNVNALLRQQQTRKTHFKDIDIAVYMDADTLPVQNPEGLFDQLRPTTQQHEQQQHEYNFAVVGRAQKYINSGIFVYRPSPQTFQALMARLQAGNYQKQHDPTEQDVLFSHFAMDHVVVQTTTRFISGAYNVRPMKKPQKDDTAVIVHWIGNPKPWTAVFGKTTSIAGQTVQNVTQPPWAVALYRCAMEQFFQHCLAVPQSQDATKLLSCEY